VTWAMDGMMNSSNKGNSTATVLMEKVLGFNIG